MTHPVRLAAFLSLSLFLSAGAEAATYAVAVTGDDKNPGTLVRPLRTINAALAKARAGDTVLVLRGTYVGRVTVRNGGSAKRPVVLRAAPKHDVVIDGNGGNQALTIAADHVKVVGVACTNARWGVFLEKRKGVVLEEVRAFKNRQFGIYVLESQGVTVRRGRVHDNAHTGIYIARRSKDVLVDGLEVDRNGSRKTPGDGIRLYATGNYDRAPEGTVENTRITIRNCDVHENYRQGIQTQRVTHLLLQNNRWRRNGASGIQVETGSRYVIVDKNLAEENNQRYFGEYGIWLDETIHGVVQNNVIRANQGGLGISQSHRLIVRRNVIHGNRGQAIPQGACTWCHRSVGGLSMGIGRETHRGAPVGATHNVFVHQTLYDNGGPDSPWGALRVINPDKRIHDNVFANTLVAGTKSPVELNLARTASFSRFDYNRYANARAPRFKLGKRELTLSGFRSAGLDVHGRAGAAGLTDPAKGDFAPLGGAALVDTGGFLTRTTKAGSGKSLPVGDVRYFCDGFGLVPGDLIQLQGSRFVATVVRVDAKAGRLILDKRLRWRADQGVAYPYAGKAPDPGALERTSRRRRSR